MVSPFGSRSIVSHVTQVAVRLAICVFLEMVNYNHTPNM